jgi:hypothetical protein
VLHIEQNMLIQVQSCLEEIDFGHFRLMQCPGMPGVTCHGQQAPWGGCSLLACDRGPRPTPANPTAMLPTQPNPPCLCRSNTCLLWATCGTASYFSLTPLLSFALQQLFNLLGAALPLLFLGSSGGASRRRAQRG